MSITDLELALRKFQQNPSQENYMYMEQLMTEYQMNPPDTIKRHLEDLLHANTPDTSVSYFPWVNPNSLNSRLAAFIATPRPQTKEDLLAAMQEHRN